MKKRKINFKKIRGVLPYIVTGVLTLGLVFVGSLDKHNSGGTISLDNFANNDYNVSVDQMSELYMVADLSDALGLASAPEVASNYVIVTSLYNSGQTSVGKMEKPNITDAINNVVKCRGIDKYTVGNGETMNDIAKKYNITTDQIRWSNDLRSTNVSPGTTLFIPCTPGIVYTVKSGDTVASIAKKYGSNETEIIALNDLEVSGLSAGMQIVIKGGSLPETERPEYVAPVYTNNYTYTYLGSSYERQDITVVGWFYNLGGPYAAGQCTQWAWYKRQDLPRLLGNAGSWAYTAAAAGYTVNRTPSAGAIFQSGGGWYGHVGYVESVNADGSIVVSEMNYIIPYRVVRSTIPASMVGRFNYIH